MQARHSTLSASISCLIASAPLSSPNAAAAEGPPEHVQLTIDRYEALLARLRAPEGASSFGRGSVLISAPQDGGSSLVAVSVSARLVASPSNSNGAVVAVLPGDVVLKAARLDGSDLTLVRRDGAYAVVLPWKEPADTGPCRPRTSLDVQTRPQRANLELCSVRAEPEESIAPRRSPSPRSEIDREKARLMPLGALLTSDPTLEEVVTLSVGETSARAPGHGWIAGGRESSS